MGVWNISRNGDPERTRTSNQLIKSQLLCQIELRGRASEMYHISQVRSTVFCRSGGVIV